MASIVAYIEVRDGAITSTSLYAVAESRRIADAAGATVYAFLPVGPIAHDQVEALAKKLSTAGADRILCSAEEALAGPALDATFGPILSQLADQLRPLLFLFPPGGPGPQLGPPLAVRIGAAYVPAATLGVHAVESAAQSPSQRVLITRWRAAHDALRRIDVGDLERPVVAVLLAGSAPAFIGECHAEVEMIPCPPAGRPSELRPLRAEPDADAGLEVCQTLVCVPAVGPTDLEPLKVELPEHACLRLDADPVLTRAAPETLLLLSDDFARLPVQAGRVGLVSAAPADLALALRRLRTPDVEPGT